MELLSLLLLLNAVTMPPKKFVGTIRRFAKPPTYVTYFELFALCLPCAYLVWSCLEVNPHDKA